MPDNEFKVEKTKSDGWTVVYIEPKIKIENIQWPLYDYVWVVDSKGDRYLSRDQGETWIRIGSLHWYWLQINLSILKIWRHYRGKKFRNRMDKAYLESLGRLHKGVRWLQALLHVQGPK